MSIKKEDFPDISQSNGQFVYKLFMLFMLNNAHERIQNIDCEAEHRLCKGDRALIYSAGDLKIRVLPCNQCSKPKVIAHARYSA